MTDTKTPVDALEGRELDAAVAREVFGLDVRGPEEYRGYWIHGESPFAYEFRSTDGDRGGDINGVPRFSEYWGPAGRVVEKVGVSVTPIVAATGERMWFAVVVPVEFGAPDMPTLSGTTAGEVWKVTARGEADCWRRDRSGGYMPSGPEGGEVRNLTFYRG